MHSSYPSEVNGLTFIRWEELEMYKCTIVDRNDMSNIRKVEFVSPHICYATPHAQRTFAIELIFDFLHEIDKTKEDERRDNN